MSNDETSRTDHPWWYAPSMRLQVTYFDPYDEFMNSDEPSAEWMVIDMRMGMLWHYLMDELGPLRVLDVAAGSGFYTAEVAWSSTQVERWKWRVVAGASSEERRKAVWSAARELGAEEFVEAVEVLDPHNLEPLEDESFDLVYAFGPLYELTDEADRQRVVTELYRILKPGGLAIATFKQRRAAIAKVVIDPDGWESEDDLVHLALFSDPEHYRPLIETPPQLSFPHYASVDEVRDLFAESGFEEVEVTPMDPLVGWVPDEVWAKVRRLGPWTFNTLSTMDGIFGEDSNLLGMSPEVMYTARKPSPLDEFKCDDAYLGEMIRYIGRDGAAALDDVWERLGHPDEAGETATIMALLILERREEMEQPMQQMLISKLDSRYFSVVAQAIEGLRYRQMVDLDIRDRVLALHDHPSAWVRVAVLHYLGTFFPNDARPLLGVALRDANANVRAIAIGELDKVAAAEFISEFERLRNDPQVDVRIAAWNALDNLGVRPEDEENESDE